MPIDKFSNQSASTSTSHNFWLRAFLRLRLFFCRKRRTRQSVKRGQHQGFQSQSKSTWPVPLQWTLFRLQTSKYCCYLKRRQLLAQFAFKKERVEMYGTMRKRRIAQLVLKSIWNEACQVRAASFPKSVRCHKLKSLCWTSATWDDHIKGNINYHAKGEMLGKKKWLWSKRWSLTPSSCSGRLVRKTWQWKPFWRFCR